MISPTVKLQLSKLGWFRFATENLAKSIPNRVVLKDPISFQLIAKPVRPGRLREAQCIAEILDRHFSRHEDRGDRPLPVFGATVRGFDAKWARSIAREHHCKTRWLLIFLDGTRARIA
jgi:hypothetical protein